MWNWQNDMDCEFQIPYSRYIASWLNVGGSLKTLNDKAIFMNWLKEIGVNELDINNIANMATNGKLELEMTAQSYLMEEKCNNSDTLMKVPEVLKGIFNKES